MKIIAECGCNWSNLKEAGKMIEKAKDAGAWAVKFQIFNKKIANNASLPHYLVIDKHKAGALINKGKDIGIPVFFTIMYPEAVDWLFDMEVLYYKIRFADNANCKIILRVLMTDKPFFISTNQSIESILGVKTDNMNSLFCIPKYPAHLQNYVLKYKIFNKFEGISDHTSGTIVLQYALRKSVVSYFEKHVKLNDHCLESKWSITFKQLKEVLEE